MSAELSAAKPKEPPPPLEEIELAAVLDAMSDPVRLEIIRQLARCDLGGELSCGQLELPVGKSTGTHHLKVLRTAGLVAERSEGTRKYLHLQREELDKRFPGLLESVLRAIAPTPDPD
jgi:DNA-binding transcriptional ArsR family regulator